jgi:putative ABC transport system substrate-binding protein
MNRRDTILGLIALSAAPLAAKAQQPGKVWRIGYLGDGSAATRASDSLDPFREALAKLGYMTGGNLSLEVRWTEGIKERRAQLAAELVRLNVDVIVTHGVVAARAVKAATTTIPIVVAVAADFLGSGLVKSLAHPGGNLTGMTDQVVELAAKEVQLLKDTLPKMQRLALMWESTNPAAAQGAEDMQVAARSMGLRVLPMLISSTEDIEQAFFSAARQHADAVIVIHTPLTVGLSGKIAQFAMNKRLPLMSAPTQFAEAGALISYGTDLASYFRRAAALVDKILKGAKPADLPIEQPTKFELVVNMKTAKALGIKIPQSVMLRADRVIE